MPPSRTFNDFESVAFEAPVVAAFYGLVGAPLESGQFLDVTALVKKLQLSGRNSIDGGIHIVLGRSVASTAASLGKNQLLVWYVTDPSEVFEDFEDVTFRGKVVAASYAPKGQFIDVFDRVRKLQDVGRNKICGGIHRAIGDPCPEVEKQLMVYYQ